MEEEEVVPLLTEEMKTALGDSKWLRSALADTTLQSLVLDIDRDPDRARKLQESRDKYPDFSGFMD
eukprot:31456-Eustigmatos_ZCMA.PRE.1